MLSGVSQTLASTEILLTGANGFLGKVVLSLLLDRFPDLRPIHILVRPREGQSAAERFKSAVLDSPPLAAIAAHGVAGSMSERVVAHSGDISQPSLGLTGEEVERLQGRVGLIINCAGRVDFFPPLDESFSSNVDGVENVVSAARAWNAKLLHVSTAFVCGTADGLIEEPVPVVGFYPRRRGASDASFDHRDELQQAREMIAQIYASSGGDSSRRSRELVQRLTALGRQRAAGWGWVNTYTYAKSLGEQIIASADGLESAIVRPAIVESAQRFPFPGWIEGGRTAAPLVLMALGGQKDWPVRQDAPLELVPVDMVAAATLIVAARLLEGRHATVYQLGSASVNPVELGSIVGWLDSEARRRGRNGNGGLNRAVIDWLAGVHRRARPRFVSEEEARARQAGREARAARLERRIAGVGRVLKKTGLPGGAALEGSRSELRKLSLQSRFREQTLEQYLPFMLQNRYIFECENIRAAYDAMPGADQALLSWDPEAIDWKDYWINCQIPGIEKWVQPEAVREWTFQI